MKQINILFSASLTMLFLFCSCEQKDNLSLIENPEQENYFIDQDKALSIATILSPDIKRGKATTKSSSMANNIIGVKNIQSIGDNNSPVYHILNYENDNGFVILSADARTPVVLAFSPNGNFEINDDMPPGLVEWMNDTELMVEGVRSGEIEPLAPAARPLLCEAIQSVTIPEEGGTVPMGPNDPCNDDTVPIDCIQTHVVQPKLQTEWGQRGGFNDLIPLQCGGDEAPVGCVAVAMGQIMYYHQYPAQYDWSAMVLDVGTMASAQLLYDAAESVDMDYACSASSAYSSDVPNALKNTFGYSSATYSNFNLSTAKQEIKNGYPIILRGDGTGGHAWVSDGYMEVNMCTYSTLSLHMNWGWNNQHNGFFIFWSPGNHDFGNNKGMVHNIRP